MTAATQEAVTREAPPSLTARVEAWIDANGITGHYDTAGIAARIVAANHPDSVERWLASNPGYLRHRCENIKDHADLTPAEAWAEDWRHGNLREDVRRWGA